MQKRAVLFLALFSALVYVATTIEGGHRDCRIAQATDGDTATMTFFISPEISLSTDPVFAYVIRGNDTTNTLQCERKKPLSYIPCEILNSQVQTEGIVNGSLTIVFSDVRQDVQGTYRMHAHFNDSWDIVSCHLTVKAGLNSTGRSDKGGSTIPVVAVIVTVVIVSAIVGIGVLCYCRPDFRKLCCERQPSMNNAPNDPETPRELPAESVESATALLAADLDYQPRDDMNTKPSENADEGETTTQNDRACADQQRLRKQDKTDSLKRSNRKLSDVSKTTRTSKSSLQPAELPEWVFQNMNRKQAKERLRSADNDDYSFMVIISEKKMFISVRLEQGRVENYRIHHKDKGYWMEPQHCFADLSKLVDHYRKFEGFLGHTLGNRIGANISTT